MKVKYSKLKRGFCYFLIVYIPLLLCSCLGGGLDLWGSKPKCIGKSSHGYFASKAYKCENGNFVTIDDEYKCVQGGCQWFSGGSTGCSWIETNLKTIVKDKHSDFYYAGDYQPVSGTILLYPLCCNVNEPFECGPAVVIPTNNDDITPATPTNPLPVLPPNSTLNINLVSPGIYNPNMQACSQDANYRLESCNSSTPDKAFWATLNHCDQIHYSDTEESEPNSKNDMNRRLNISFGLQYWSEGNFLVAVLDNDYAGEDLPSDPWKYDMVLDYQVLNKKTDLVHQVTATDGSMQGLAGMVVPFTTDKAIISSSVKQPATINYKSGVFQKKADNTYKLVSPCNGFSITNRYTYGQLTANTRDLNIICFKNGGEAASFKSDIRGYSYASIGSFEKHLSKTFGEQVGCRINLAPINQSGVYMSNEVLPSFLVDKDGNAVLFKEDFILNKIDGKIDFTLFNASIDATGVAITSGKKFHKEIVDKWYARMLAYIRKGVAGSWPVHPLDLYEGEVPYQTPPVAMSAAYQNLIALVAVNGYVIKVRPSQTSAPGIAELATDVEENDRLKLFLAYGTPDVGGETLSGTLTKNIGQCPQAISEIEKYTPGNYTPLCVVFANVLKKIDNVDFSGMVICTALHELAHAWYGTGVTGYCDSKTDEEDHKVYSYGGNTAYFDIMRYIPPTYWPSSQYYSSQIRIMRFSEGVAERMRNVLMCTYQKASR